MDNKALLDKLTAQVSILEHHIRRLKKNPDELHELDIELMGEKIKVIYNLIHDLQTGSTPKKKEATAVNHVEKVPLVEVKPEPEIPAPKAPEMKTEESADLEIGNSDLKEEGPTELEVEKETPTAEIKVEEVTSSDVAVDIPTASSEQPAASNEQPASSNEQAETLETPKTTADLFSGPPTIADSFQAEDDNSIAAKVNPQAIEDLKMAIGINDKFLFINELFKGDPGVYNQAIQSLNSAAGMSEAVAEIESFRGEYAWADNSEAYHRLKKIVMSKYNG